jgi:outer membrane protein assembly factor BamB
MQFVSRVDSRRVLVFGAAGLVPAALVTLLLVHQPSIGDRRLYPLLRGSLAFAGLALALAALIAWATAPDRLSRSSLTGLAWAGVTTILCIGPFLESTPRARLYALDLADGDVVWATRRAGAAPVLVDPDLVVTDVGDGSLVGLDPASGRERWRHSIDTDDPQGHVVRALAAGAYAPGPDAAAAPALDASETGYRIVDGGVQVTGSSGGEPWSTAFPGERALAVVPAGDSAYVYVSTPGAGDIAGGSVVKLDADDGRVRWRKALPPDLVAVATTPALGANSYAVAVAGGEEIGVLDADDGKLRWTQSVVTLGKSRGYALPGAVQHVTVTDSLVYLSTTPDS